jgi:hypothetical protein
VDFELSNRDDLGVRMFRFRRYYYAGSDALSKPPLIFLGVIVGAIVGTATALGPSPVVTRGGHLVVAEPPTAEVLLRTLAGGGTGLFVVFVGGFLWGWLRYRRWGDAIWMTKCGGVSDAGMTFVLTSKDDVIPADPKHLGALLCVVRSPLGTLTHDELAYTNTGLAIAHIKAKPEAGPYDVRWLGAREGEKLHEKAHRTIIFVANDAGKISCNDT